MNLIHKILHLGNKNYLCTSLFSITSSLNGELSRLEGCHLRKTLSNVVHQWYQEFIIGCEIHLMFCTTLATTLASQNFLDGKCSLHVNVSLSHHLYIMIVEMRVTWEWVMKPPQRLWYSLPNPLLCTQNMVFRLSCLSRVTLLVLDTPKWASVRVDVVVNKNHDNCKQYKIQQHCLLGRGLPKREFPSMP